MPSSCRVQLWFFVSCSLVPIHPKERMQFLNVMIPPQQLQGIKFEISQVESARLFAQPVSANNTQVLGVARDLLM